MKADSIVSDTNGYINFWLRSFDTRREIQFLNGHANHTILAAPHARCISWCLKSLPVGIGKTQPHASTVENSTISLQNPQILRTISSWHDLIHTPTHFLSGVLLLQILIVISFPCGRKTVPSDYAPRLRDPSSLKPYKIK